MDKFNMADMSVWQGRQDPEDGELALRWHDKVQAWPLSSASNSADLWVGLRSASGVFMCSVSLLKCFRIHCHIL